MGPLTRLAALAMLAAALCLAAASAGGASAAAGRGGAGSSWARLLAREEARFPDIAPRAAAAAAGRPLYLRVAYVAGAIGGWREREVCPLLGQDPHGFLLAARQVLFAGHGAYAYARARRWRVGTVVKAYRAGVAFGCARR